jgi:hypothetical protein
METNASTRSPSNAPKVVHNARVRLRTDGKRSRSAVTSGRQLFINGDPNTAWARRFHDLVMGHVADAGGRDMLSEARYALCKRAAALECELERWEAKLSQGIEVDLDKYGRASSHLRRILESLGLERKQRDVLSLGEVLRNGHRSGATP